MGDWGGKPNKRSIDKKPPELDEKMWEENQKIIDIVNKKTFQPGLRTGKEKLTDGSGSSSPSSQLYQNRSQRVRMYICGVRSSRVTRQELYHLASTPANTDGLLVSDLRHLASTLTNTDDILKVDLRQTFVIEPVL